MVSSVQEIKQTERTGQLESEANVKEIDKLRQDVVTVGGGEGDG